MTASNSLSRQQVPQQTLAQARELTIDMVCETTGYTPMQLALIWRTVAADAPLLELAQFLHACKTLQLDPLLRQAYWIRRKVGSQKVDGEWEDTYKGVLQVGIDGFRSLADRQGNYAGSEPPSYRGQKEITFVRKHWEGERGNRHQVSESVVLVVPDRAQVVCWKIVQGHKAAFTGEARWDEFYPGEAQGSLWHKMPFHQLAKCAEAQALRKGWPALLGSLDLDAAGGDSGATDELPTVAAPSLVVEEQPQVSERTRVVTNAAKYDKYIGANYGEDYTAAPLQPTSGPEPGPTEPEDASEPERDEPPADGAKAALLTRNTQLVAEAREAGIKGLAPFTCNTTWPDDKIEAANKELYSRVAARNGDSTVAKAAEAAL